MKCVRLAILGSSFFSCGTLRKVFFNKHCPNEHFRERVYNMNGLPYMGAPTGGLARYWLKADDGSELTLIAYRKFTCTGSYQFLGIKFFLMLALKYLEITVK